MRASIETCQLINDDDRFVGCLRSVGFLSSGFIFHIKHRCSVAYPKDGLDRARQVIPSTPEAQVSASEHDRDSLSPHTCPDVDMQCHG